MKDCSANAQGLREDYYKNLWESKAWGTEEPNADENLRLDAIRRLIETDVIPNSGRRLKILDLGCGRGWLTRVLSQYGSTIGVDPVSSGIERAKKLFPEIDFRVGDANTILESEKPCSFDLIVSSEVIEHVPNMKKRHFLESIQRLLSVNGFVILTTPRAEVWLDWKKLGKADQPIEEWISERALDALSQQVGLVTIKRERLAVRKLKLNWANNILASRFFTLTFSRSLDSFAERWLKYYCGLYQVVLLQRVDLTR